MQHYDRHIETLETRWSETLTRAGFDAALIPAGTPQSYLFDDQAPPFRPNPHFQQWVPYDGTPHGMLLLAAGRKPQLFLFQPADFWHAPADLPTWIADQIDTRAYGDLEQLHNDVYAECNKFKNLCMVGEADDDKPLGVLNPPSVLAPMDYVRADKTAFELACLRHATEVAVRGHRAARDAFSAGASEFEINAQYLLASRQHATELPYPNIVALNDHAGTLHYQHYDRTAPEPYLSFLIDAGARSNGYAADITRTYVSESAPESAAADTYRALIKGLDDAQRAVCSTLKPGIEYLELHENMHGRIAELLAAAGVFRCSGAAAIDAGLTLPFFPHGLGHLIGLQTHDVGGHQVSVDGTLRPPPDRYPALRLMRTTQPGQTFTVEPGIYFIPMLLEEVREGRHADLVAWDAVDALVPFGGIRIEDNVVITATGHENYTRDAFARD